MQINNWFSQITKFGITSLTGLTIDFFIYFALIQSHVLAGFSNFISSGIAVVVVYVLSTKFVFNKRKQNSLQIFSFFAYYALSISIFSIVIQIILFCTDANELTTKFWIIPISFIANFIFSKAIIERIGKR